MKLRDPKADPDRDGRPDGYVSVSGTLVAVADDGTFESEAISEAWARGYAEREGVALSDVLVEERDEDETEAAESDGICGAEMSDGSICERPADECPYHGDE